MISEVVRRETGGPGTASREPPALLDPLAGVSADAARAPRDARRPVGRGVGKLHFAPKRDGGGA